MSVFDAAEFAEKWADSQRGWAEVASVLRSIGSIDLALSERHTLLEATIARHAAKLAEIADAEKQLDDIRLRHEADVGAHTDTLSQSAAATKAETDAIIAAAREEALAMVGAARADIAMAYEDHAKAVNAAIAVSEAEAAKVSAMQSRIAALTEEHTVLMAKTEAMKALARGFFDG